MNFLPPFSQYLCEHDNNPDRGEGVIIRNFTKNTDKIIKGTEEVRNIKGKKTCEKEKCMKKD